MTLEETIESLLDKEENHITIYIKNFNETTRVKITNPINAAIAKIRLENIIERIEKQYYLDNELINELKKELKDEN